MSIRDEHNLACERDDERFAEWASALGMDSTTIEGIVASARVETHSAYRGSPKSYLPAREYCAWHWSRRVITLEECVRAVDILAAYRAWLNDLDAAEWSYERTIHYADNSTVHVERSSKTGKTRERMLVAPHGDACF